MTIIYIGGVKGVGKSFALCKVFDQLSLSGPFYERAKVAEVMFELSKNQGIIKEYDELENVSPEVKRDIRLKAFQKILTNGKRNLIFDGHYSVSSIFGYEYGIPLEFVKEIDYIVLLHNNSEVILRRRKRDMSKAREISLEKVKLDLTIEEAFARFYAQVIGKELKMIKTDNEASSKLISFLKEVAKNG